MFATNVNPASVLSSGLLLASGNNRHFYARTIMNTLLAATGSVWTEVTGSSPTPAWLQPYASTVTGTTGTTNGETVHCTAYLNIDPRLGDEKTVLIRLWVKAGGVEFGLIDTAGGDPDTYSQWQRPASNAATSASLIAATHLLWNTSVTSGNSNATSATSFANGPWRFLYWMWDDALFLGCVHTSSGIVQIQGIGHPNNGSFVPVAAAPAGCFGMIPVVWSGTNAYSGTNMSALNCISYPQVTTNAPTQTTALVGGYRGVSSALNTLADGRQVIEPASVLLLNGMNNVYAPPRMKRISSGFVTNFTVLTIGGDDYMYFNNGGTFPFLMKFAD